MLGHCGVDGSERKVANEYNFNHRLAHPVARRWRRLLRVQSVWWSWARRRSGFGIDHSPRALVFWRSAYLKQLIWMRASGAAWIFSQFVVAVGMGGLSAPSELARSAP